MVLEAGSPRSKLYDVPPAPQITIKPGIGVPVTEGVADIIRSHHAFFARQNATLHDISILGCEEKGAPQHVLYGQVLTVEEAAGERGSGGICMDLVLVRWYESPEDSYRCPLGMRPLAWQEVYNADQKIATTGDKLGPPVYGLVDVQSVMARLCVVRDYARKNGHFLINDLIRWMPEELQPVVPEFVVQHEVAQRKQAKMNLLDAACGPAKQPATAAASASGIAASTARMQRGTVFKANFSESELYDAMGYGSSAFHHVPMKPSMKKVTFAE